ncbi:MAG: ROK family protein [Lachnospiraceae bacterium]|nr:ROK family protein [Lachnospiraceae bacterium]
MSYIFGVDVGGTTVKLGLFNEQGDVLEKWEVVSKRETTKEVTEHQLLKDVAASVVAKCEERAIPSEEIIGLGIGIPGAVRDDGTVVDAVNLGWGIFNVKHELASYLPFENIVVSNDANIAALGEQWKGSGADYNTIVMVTLGTGIGGGIVLNGKIWNGTSGAGGEIGHTKVPGDRLCNCGCRGCLERYTAAAGIVQNASELLMQSEEESVLRSAPELNPKVIFDAAKEGDPIAKGAIEIFGDKMAFACANISNILNPEAIIIGGGISRAGQIILDTVEKYYRPRLMTALSGTVLKLAVLGNDAGIYGAARMVMGK